MKQNQNTLTREELEVLSRAYLDCRLAKFQEKELELVLLSTDISSPVIDEARETMGISTMLESAVPPRRKKSLFRSRWMGWSAAAVALAVVGGMALRTNMQGGVTSESEYDVIVYVDGQRLDCEQALEEAMTTQAQCMAMLDNTTAKVASLQNKSAHLITLMTE